MIPASKSTYPHPAVENFVILDHQEPGSSRGLRLNLFWIPFT